MSNYITIVALCELVYKFIPWSNMVDKDELLLFFLSFDFSSFLFSVSFKETSLFLTSSALSNKVLRSSSTWNFLHWKKKKNVLYFWNKNFVKVHTIGVMFLIPMGSYFFFAQSKLPDWKIRLNQFVYSLNRKYRSISSIILIWPEFHKTCVTSSNFSWTRWIIQYNHSWTIMIIHHGPKIGWKGEKV